MFEFLLSERMLVRRLQGLYTQKITKNIKLSEQKLPIVVQQLHLVQDVLKKAENNDSLLLKVIKEETKTVFSEFRKLDSQKEIKLADNLSEDLASIRKIIRNLELIYSQQVLYLKNKNSDNKSLEQEEFNAIQSLYKLVTDEDKIRKALKEIETREKPDLRFIHGFIYLNFDNTITHEKYRNDISRVVTEIGFFIKDYRYNKQYVQPGIAAIKKNEKSLERRDMPYKVILGWDKVKFAKKWWLDLSLIVSQHGTSMDDVLRVYQEYEKIAKESRIHNLKVETHLPKKMMEWMGWKFVSDTESGFKKYTKYLEF